MFAVGNDSNVLFAGSPLQILSDMTFSYDRVALIDDFGTEDGSL